MILKIYIKKDILYYKKNKNILMKKYEKTYLK